MMNATKTASPLTVAETASPLTVAEIVKAMTIYIMSSAENEQISVRMCLEIDETPPANYPSFTIRIASENAHYGTESDYENRLKIIDIASRAVNKFANAHDFRISFRAFGVCSWEFIAETNSKLLGFIWLEWTTRADIKKAGENK